MTCDRSIRLVQLQNVCLSTYGRSSINTNNVKFDESLTYASMAGNFEKLNASSMRQNEEKLE